MALRPHGALAALPGAGQLVAARQTFDAANTSVQNMVAAATVMARLGNSRDQARAHAYLRERRAS